MEAKDFLQQKLDKLDLGLIAEHGKIEKLHLPDRKILLSAPITGAYNEEDFAVLTEFSFRLKKLFGLYDNFGSRIASENIRKGEFQRYDSFFAYGRNDVEEYDEIRSEGEYLRTFCVGGWDKLKDVYQMLMAYAKEHGLVLCDYAYEEGIQMVWTAWTRPRCCFNSDLGQFTRNYTQTTKRGLLTTNKG